MNKIILFSFILVLNSCNIGKVDLDKIDKVVLKINELPEEVKNIYLAREENVISLDSNSFEHKHTGMDDGIFV